MRDGNAAKTEVTYVLPDVNANDRNMCFRERSLDQNYRDIGLRRDVQRSGSWLAVVTISSLEVSGL